jgi:hypothetical protein
VELPRKRRVLRSRKDVGEGSAEGHVAGEVQPTQGGTTQEQRQQVTARRFETGDPRWLRPEVDLSNGTDRGGRFLLRFRHSPTRAGLTQVPSMSGG